MNRPPKYACNYAVLRFRPYPETAEFVNLGVVVHCPMLGFFDTQIETHKVARVTNFFPELDRQTFAAARKTILEEVGRIKKMILNQKDVELGRILFGELVRPREAVFRFGEIRTIMADDPTALAGHLFAQYVLRHFAQVKEYQETVMADRFFKALKEFRPNQTFHRNKAVGTEEYRIRIPICSDWRSPEGVPMRAVKPLDLQKKETTDIIEHGDLWAQRLRRLRMIDRLPERLIFAVRHPRDIAGENAAKDVLAGLKDAGGILVDAANTERILELAAD